MCVSDLFFNNQFGGYWKNQEPANTSCNFITRKGNKPSSLNQIFGFLQHQLVHTTCHPPTNYIRLMGSWKILDIKELQQLVHIFIVYDRSTLRCHVKVNNKLNHNFLPFGSTAMKNLTCYCVFFNICI
jgi:hypothetical protein